MEKVEEAEVNNLEISVSLRELLNKTNLGVEGANWHIACITTLLNMSSDGALFFIKSNVSTLILMHKIKLNIE